MPKDKNPVERYRRIAEIFHRRRGSHAVVRMQDLADELGISIRQLGVDLKYMREKGAPLEYVAADRGWRFQEGADFAFVDDQILSDEDVMNIRIAIETFNKINNRDQSLGSLPKVFHKIYKAARKWTQPGNLQKSIYFDPLPHYEGSRHIRFFLQSIDDSRRVEFQYKGYHAPEPKTVLFDPWFLRHYDRRWYAGGFSHDPSEQFVRTFPLERIVGTPKAVGFFHDKPPDYDAESYWRHIYGITVPPNGIVEEVVLEFNYLLGCYFLDTPFFEPFEVLARDEEKIVVQLHIIPNIDLIRKLASLGADVRVLTPQSLADTLERFFEAALAHARTGKT
jgi:predicted DNA-binding transcriptional regulator YafY